MLTGHTAGQGKTGPTGLAEWGQTVKGPRAVGLSVEVRGLVVLVEGAEFNHVPFCGEPDLRVLREPSSALRVLTAALISCGFILPGGWGRVLAFFVALGT